MVLETYHGIETEVLVPESDETHTLTVRCYEMDVVEFWLDGKKVFSGDWSGNFKAVIEEMRDNYSK
jgi:hypothetical protein